MKKLWIENRDGHFVLHSREPQLGRDGLWPKGSWWVEEFVPLAILGRTNLPRPGQVAEVHCEFETHWEPDK